MPGEINWVGGQTQFEYVRQGSQREMEVLTHGFGSRVNCFIKICLQMELIELDFQRSRIHYVCYRKENACNPERTWI